MGIDARLVAVISDYTPTEPEIKLWSARLCKAVGAEHFFTDREKGRLAIDLTDHPYGEPEKPRGKFYEQDGPDILAGENELFLEVALWSRYYGPGYERGDWETICSVAEWCEMNLPNCRVLYGGDSSGVCAELFDREAREALKRYALGDHGRDYFKSYDQGRASIQPPIDDCKLCVREYYVPQRFGWGGGGDTEFAKFHCAVCGEDFLTRDGGKTWKIGKEAKE